MIAASVIELDQKATLILNSFHCPAGDYFWLMMSDKLVWIPFYLLLVYIIFRRLGWKRALVLLAAIGIGLLISDRVSTLVKNSVCRLRPCYTTGLLEEGLHTPEGRGGFYGFFSSHASNAFMLFACILTGLKADKSRKHRDIAITCGIWAALVSISRVMMGRHYLGDVLVGAAFGLLTGVLMGLAARAVMNWLTKQESPSPSGSPASPSQG